MPRLEARKSVLGRWGDIPRWWGPAGARHKEAAVGWLLDQAAGFVNTNPNPEVGKSGAVGKAVLAQDLVFDGAKSFSFF